MVTADEARRELARRELARRRGAREQSGSVGVRLPEPAAEAGVLNDLLGSAGAGLRSVAEGFIGQAGDAQEIGANTGAAAARGLGLPAGRGSDMLSEAGRMIADMPFGGPVATIKRWIGDKPVSTEDVNQQTTKVLGENYQPKTTGGEITKTATEFLPALMSPGGKVRKVASWLGATAGAEGGEKAAQMVAPDLAPYAKMIGGLVGGMVPAAVRTGVDDMTRVIRQMERDGLTPDQIRARISELGPGAMPMDVGPNLRQEAQRIYAKGGPGRAIIDNALTPRDQQANARIRSEVDSNLGPAPVPSLVEEGLRRTKRSLSPEYEKALGNARAVNTEAIANDIQSAIANERGRARAVLKEVLDDLRIEGTEALDPHPRAALATRQAIDGMLKGEKDTNVIRVLTGIRKKLDAQLTMAVPGIKAVDAKYAHLSQQEEAFTRGRSVLDSGREAPTPTDVAKDAGKNQATRFRLAQGARADIERIIGTNANDRVALQRIIKGEGDWNPQKLAILFGKDKADRIMQVLEREKVFSVTSERVLRNSATAERLPEDNGGSGLGLIDAVKVGGPKAALYAAPMRAVEAIVDRVRKRAAEARDTNVARYLTTTDRNGLEMVLRGFNGGRKLDPKQLDAAINAMLLAPGATAPLRAPVEN